MPVYNQTPIQGHLQMHLAGNQYVGDTVNSDLRQMMLTFDTNFWGSIRVLQAALPLMPTSGTSCYTILAPCSMPKAPLPLEGCPVFTS